MESQTIYDDDVTNNDVLLLPISDSSNLKVDLGAVDLSSIVEGIEEDGDDDDMNIDMSMGMGMSMSMGMGMGMNAPSSLMSDPKSPRLSQHDHSPSRSVNNKSSQNQNQGRPQQLNQEQAPSQVQEEAKFQAQDQSHSQAHAQSQTQSVTPTDPLDASLEDKDFLQHFGDIFSNEHDGGPAINPLEHAGGSGGGGGGSNINNSSHAHDFNVALTNIEPDPLPTVQFASKGHPGNNRFYILLCMHRKEFLKAAALGSTKVCDQIAQKILKNICSDSVPNGRFLECNIKSWSQNSWRNIAHEKNIIEIVKWALKEPPKAEVAHYFKPQAVDLRRQSSSFDPADKGQGHATSSFPSSACCSQLAAFDSVSSRGIPSPSKMNAVIKDPSSPGSHNNNDHSHSSQSHHHSKPAKVLSLGERHAPRRCSLDTYSEENWEDGSSNHGSNSSESNHRGTGAENAHAKDDGGGGSGGGTCKKKRRSSHAKRADKGNRNGGLKRRGTISSNETTRSKSRKKINLADLRFSVSGQLSKLVEEVFAPQPQQTETTCNSEASGSMCKGGGLSSGRGRNKRKSKATSVSSMTSTINRLRNDLVHVNFQDNNNNNDAAVVSPGVMVSQESTTVITRDGKNRALGAYDVVLTDEMNLHASDHVGNNRFRTMLQMHRQTFHNPQTPTEDQTKICNEIIHQVSNGRKGKGKFLRKSGETWVEVEQENIQSLVFRFLMDCVVDISLGLPSLSTATKLLSNPLEGKKGCYKQLHGAALESLKKSKKKKAFRGLDTRSIEKLQTQMLEKRYDTS